MHDRHRGHGRTAPTGSTTAAASRASGPNGAYEASEAHAYSPTMYGGYSGAGVEHGYGAAVVRYP